MNRKLVVLISLLAALVLSLVYAFWSMPRQEQAAPAPAGRAAPRRPPSAQVPLAQAAPAAAGRLNLFVLTRAQEPFPGATRDIFRYKASAPVRIEAPVVSAPEPPPPPPPPPPTPDELLRQELTGYQVVGSLDKGGRRSVFISGGGETYVVREGQAFGPGDRYLAGKLNGAVMVVTSRDGRASASLPLPGGEDRPPAGSYTPPPADNGEAPRPMPSERSLRRPRRSVPIEMETPLPDENQLPDASVPEQDDGAPEPPSGDQK